MRAGAFGLALAALLLLGRPVGASPEQIAAPRSAPPDEDRLLNAPVPDIELTTATGARVHLSQLGAAQPLLLTFVFTRCAGVCSPFLMSWRIAERSVGRPRAYHRLVLSFDPRDTAADMATLAHHLEVESSPDWTLAVAAPADVRRLADATGFWYDWDEQTQQFDHPAMIAAVRRGRVVRLLVGGTVTSARLDEITREVTGEFVSSYPLPGRVRFRCVQFDPRTGRAALDWGFAFLLLPVVSTSAATAALFTAGARARRRRPPQATQPRRPEDE